MDFIIDLQKYNEVNAILVIFDRFIKTTEFIAIAIFLNDFKDELEIIIQIIISHF